MSVHIGSLMTSQIPTAPFVVASFGVGMFSLLPYFALWSPLPRDERMLPPKSELVSIGLRQAYAVRMIQATGSRI